MISLDINQRRMLLKVAKNMSLDELEKYHKIFIDKEVVIGKERAVGIAHEEFQHIIDIAKELDADFILSKEEEKKLNEGLLSPIIITYETEYVKTRPNEKCLLNKTIPEIHMYMNKILGGYDARRHTKMLAFIYNYLVENRLEERAMNIVNIKEQLLKNKQEHKPSSNYNQPKEKEKAFEQDVPF